MASQLREIFLREFTKQLILNSKKPETRMISFHPVKMEEQAPLVIPRTREIRAEPRHPEIIKNIRFMHPQAQTAILQSTPKTETIPIPPAPQIISPSPLPLPEGFSLGKLNLMIQDNRVTSIECQGPGKIILVRILGKVSSTQIVLSEEEIKNIISTFAREAKIPAIGGVFKAAVGNLVITAVISDFVGSRFIINKHTPYSLLEQAQQQVPQFQLR